MSKKHKILWFAKHDTSRVMGPFDTQLEACQAVVDRRFNSPHGNPFVWCATKEDYKYAYDNMVSKKEDD